MSTRLERQYFEDLYARDADPWDFATSAYERGKYARTLDALGERRFGRALEIGCSIGVFTTLLAPRCEELVAVDVAEPAVVATRARLSTAYNVRVERRTLPEGLPAGPWDLIVASEVLYYWDRGLLLASLPRLEMALATGGSLLAVHWRPPTRTYPLGGDEVHDLLRASTTLAHGLSETEPRYRLDRFDKRPDP